MALASPLIRKLTQSGVLTEADHEPLAALCAAPRAVAPGTVLVAQGKRVTGTPVVLDGFACRYKVLPDGQRQITGLLLPGDLCDVQGAVLGRSDHFTTALTTCTLVWLTRETVDALTLAPTRIARALWWATLVDECILRAWMTNLGQREADNALAHLCCEVLLRLQVVGRAEADGCALPFTQEQLGDVLGITHVHVNRVLKELRAHDLLEIRGKRLAVPDVARLRAYCDFDPSYLHLNAWDGASA